MNDTNNNLNGTVLGEVNNPNNPNNLNNNPMPSDVEMLDMSVSNELPTSQGMDNSNNGVQPQSTYFNNPPANESPETVAGSQVINQPMPQVEPTPAYTSLQSINPAPMPGFENSEAIGTTPPISLEPDKQPKKKKSNKSKIIFIIIVLVVLAGVGFGTYYVLNYTDLLNKEAKITIETKDLEIKVGDTLSDKITDYATIEGTDTKNCSLDKKDVNVSEVGQYTYKITCGKTVKEGKIVVIAKDELVVNTKTLYKVIGSTLDVNEFIVEPSNNYTYELVDAETIQTNLATEGTYAVKIKATDKSGKVLEVDAKLVVLQYQIKGYLTCGSNGQILEGTSAEVINSLKFAIAKDAQNQSIYGKVAYEIYTFKYSDETEYANLLAQYKSEGKITINNITGDANFDDETFTITITNEKDNSTLVAEYGEAVFEKYSTIKTYFESTKGYTCTYKNENA